MDKQVRLVCEALAQSTHGHVTVRGMLCFVDAHWPVLGGSFTISGHDVLWPKKAFNQLTQPGPLDPPMIEVILRVLAARFPQA